MIPIHVQCKLLLLFLLRLFFSSSSSFPFQDKTCFLLLGIIIYAVE